jgi:uncharacterized membrane protein YfcA
MIILFTAYLLTGILSSFLSGLLGIGGGLIIVPALTYIFSYFDVIPSDSLMHIVIATSMAGAITNLAFSLSSHYRQNNIDWRTVKIFSPGIIIGSLFIGPLIMLVLSSSHLQVIFGLSCLYFGLQMFFSGQKANAEEKLPSRSTLFSLGLGAGTLSTLVGISGGTIIGTILNYYHMNMRKVIGTTTAIAFILTITGTIGLLVVGYQAKISLPWCTGFIYWPAVLGIALASPLFAPIGVKLGHKLPTDTLRKLFAFLMLLVGIKMMF